MKKTNLILKAKRYCDAEKYRFTKPRERVLTILAHAKQPMGAYQVLKSLSSREEQIKPPTVYRAIEFWLKHGFIHRIESMNAYIACCEHFQHNNFCIFICDVCQQVMELDMPPFPSSAMAKLEKKQLIMNKIMTEIHGKCHQCH